jgi:hypothetical protein
LKTQQNFETRFSLDKFLTRVEIEPGGFKLWVRMNCIRLVPPPCHVSFGRRELRVHPKRVPRFALGRPLLRPVVLKWLGVIGRPRRRVHGGVEISDLICRRLPRHFRVRDVAVQVEFLEIKEINFETGFSSL